MLTHSWAPCCKTWAEKKNLRLLILGEKKNVCVVGYPVSWAPCCKWTSKPKVGCHIVVESKVTLGRTWSDSITCVYTRGPWAVEYLANLVGDNECFQSLSKQWYSGLISSKSFYLLLYFNIKDVLVYILVKWNKENKVKEEKKEMLCWCLFVS